MLGSYFEHGDALIESAGPVVDAPENVGTGVDQRLRWELHLSVTGAISHASGFPDNTNLHDLR